MKSPQLSGDNHEIIVRDIRYKSIPYRLLVRHSQILLAEPVSNLARFFALLEFDKRLAYFKNWWRE